MWTKEEMVSYKQEPWGRLYGGCIIHLKLVWSFLNDKANTGWQLWGSSSLVLFIVTSLTCIQQMSSECLLCVRQCPGCQSQRETRYRDINTDSSPLFSPLPSFSLQLPYCMPVTKSLPPPSSICFLLLSLFFLILP